MLKFEQPFQRGMTDYGDAHAVAIDAIVRFCLWKRAFDALRPDTAAAGVKKTVPSK